MRPADGEEALERVRAELRDVEREMEQLNESWLRLLGVIQDLDYLQRIRDLGTRDHQQLSAALSRVKDKVRALRARLPRSTQAPATTAGPQSPPTSGGG